MNMADSITTISGVTLALGGLGSFYSGYRLYQATAAGFDLAEASAPPKLRGMANQEDPHVLEISHLDGPPLWIFRLSGVIAGSSANVDLKYLPMKMARAVGRSVALRPGDRLDCAPARRLPENARFTALWVLGASTSLKSRARPHLLTLSSI
jgi:hypothetical protein